MLDGKAGVCIRAPGVCRSNQGYNLEVVSFRVATTNGAPWYNNVYHGQVLESSSGTELSTIGTGLSYPGLDSIVISITSQDDSSATKNGSSLAL